MHHLLEQRDKTAARRLYDGVGIADDHGRGAAAVELHAALRYVLRREQVGVLNDQSGLTGQDPCALPASDGCADAVQLFRKRGKRFGVGNEHACGEARQQHGCPRPEKALSAAHRGQNGQHERHRRHDRGIDAHDAAARVRHFQLDGELCRVARRTEDAVVAVPRLFLPHGGDRLFHVACRAQRPAPRLI